MRRLLSISALVLSLAVAGALRADEPAPADAPPVDAQGADSLVQLSRGTQALDSKFTPSLIRVRIDQVFQSLLAQPQRREFNDWLKAQPASQPQPAPQPARPMLALFRKFLEQKLSDPQLTPEDARTWKYIQNRLQQPVQETTGVIVDAQGEALVLGNWVKDGQPLSIRVTLPDGTETNAKYVGGHPARGLAIIKLDSAGAAPALHLAQDAPAPGDLLMCMSATSGGIGLDIAPGPAPKRNNGEQRFAIYGNEDHGPILVINTSGELTAVGRRPLRSSHLLPQAPYPVDHRQQTRHRPAPARRHLRAGTAIATEISPSSRQPPRHRRRRGHRRLPRRKSRPEKRRHRDNHRSPSQHPGAPDSGRHGHRNRTGPDRHPARQQGSHAQHAARLRPWRPPPADVLLTRR